jgi:hypothetical protein
MGKISNFSLNVSVGGIQSYFASKHRPNIFNVPITIKAHGTITAAELDAYDRMVSNLTVAERLATSPIMATG